MGTGVKKAIVTMAIGEKHAYLFDKCSRKSWENYCDKHGYDLIVIDQVLDKTDRAKSRHMGWQKLLILSQPWSGDYDRIVWLDSDIIINNNSAPDISGEVPVDRVGGCNHYGCPSEGVYSYSLTAKFRQYDNLGIKLITSYTPQSFHQDRIENAKGLDKVLCTGVFVCSPKHHRELFEEIYEKYEEGDHGEMPYVSYGLQDAGVMYWLPQEWNVIVSTYTAAFYPELFWNDKREANFIAGVIMRIKYKAMRRHYASKKAKALLNIYNVGYFIHFGGCHRDMLFLDCGKLQ